MLIKTFIGTQDESDCVFSRDGKRLAMITCEPSLGVLSIRSVEILCRTQALEFKQPTSHCDVGMRTVVCQHADQISSYVTVFMFSLD